MEKYNRYNEYLDIDCGYNKTKSKKDDYCYIDGIFCYKN